MFYYYVEEEKKKNYIQNLREKSKRLDKENRDFIELFLKIEEKDKLTSKADDNLIESMEEDELKLEADDFDELDDLDILEQMLSDEDEYSSYNIGREWVKIKEKEFAKKEKIELKDIFPKSIYPSLDLMMGEYNRKVFIEACNNMVKCPYTVGYYRKPVRSSNYKNHLKNITNVLLPHMINFYVIAVDEIATMKGDSYNNYRLFSNSDQIAALINLGDKIIINYIKDMITADNNHATVNYDTFRVIFRSSNKELLELTGKMLLAAKLQEGLRQAICETMDSGHYENFVYMFNIVYENNLLRFSSVKRALGTWTGLGEEFGERISKKELEIIHRLINDSYYEDELLKSDDNMHLYMGLWSKSNKDVTYAIEAMKKILKKGKRHSILLMSYFLNMIQDDKLSLQTARQIISENSDDIEIIACYFRAIFGYISFYNIENHIENNEIGIEKYFKNKKEAIEFFDILEKNLLSMKDKTKTFSPCIFPWYSVTISKEDIANGLLLIAMLEGDKLVDRAMDYIKLTNTYQRGNVAKVLLQKPKSQKQKDTVISLLSGSVDTKIMYDIVTKNALVKDYKEQIEDNLRLKSADVRQNIINILYTQDEKNIKSSVSNLLSAKVVNKRLGGLDLLIKLKKDGKVSKKEIKEMTDSIKDPTPSEEILINELITEEKKEVNTLYDKNYKIDLKIEIEEGTKKKGSNLKKKSDTIIISDIMDSKKIFDLSREEFFEILKKFDDLVVKHEKYEYKTAYNQDMLLGDIFTPIKYAPYGQNRDISFFPLSELWCDFYEKEIGDFKKLFQVDMILNGANIYKKNEYEKHRKYIKELLGIDFLDIGKEIVEKDFKYLKLHNYQANHVTNIISALYYSYKQYNLKYLFEVSKSIVSNIYLEIQKNGIGKFLTKSEYDCSGKEYYCDLNSLFIFREAFDLLDSYETDEEFIQSFGLSRMINKIILDYGKNNDLQVYGLGTSILELANAIRLKLLKKDAFYVEILEDAYDDDDISSYISRIYDYIMGEGQTLKHSTVNKKYYQEEHREVFDFIKEHGQKISDYIVDLELRRGDSPTKYSRAIHRVRKIKGIDNLIKILTALNNEKLDRVKYYWNSDDSKKSTLSHLLKLSEPAEGDTSKKLKEKIKNTGIDDKKLIEVAMYAPAWIAIIEECLKWKGMASACYYFQAHISDVDEKKAGIIAKYTPISIEDLASGAFDVDWFKSAYKEVGKERFELLYECAKYISDGAKHSRARMFADAVNGKLKLKDTQKLIEEKRNKDLVASYALIPLAKDKMKDLVARYKFLQKFLKESKAFGAQRRASEAKAVSIAMENLSRNAGYGDVTRLTWAMENQIMEEIRSYLTPKEVDGVSVWIEIDDGGKSSIVYEKDGKQLKSAPTKLKKHKYVEELKEINKNLKDQYSRSKKMLEESMEDATEFFVHEIENLTSNPVIYPLIKDLVFTDGKNLGYYSNYNLVDTKAKSRKLGEDDKIKIAHSLDLYNAKKWADFQKDLFDRQVKQPFKQIFRELYIKTKDEIGRDTSLRYAGHQIQPSKTVAMLKTRRWVVDSEEGLQKVYYKQNIIAKIYALADWFSPADIEAPTLEFVEFFDRKTFKKMMIDDVPDLIFTEVMRDVDLVVSVAHVGGVDVEASHSTIEMRRAIVEFNLKLFKIKNVSFTDNFALIDGSLAQYSIHLGSGVVHQKAGATINVLPVHSQHRGRLFLPFVDEDPKTAQIMSEIILFAEDSKIKDPFILDQIQKKNK